MRWKVSDFAAKVCTKPLAEHFANSRGRNCERMNTENKTLFGKKS